MMGEHLAKTFVHLTKNLPPHHGHFVDDEVFHVCQGLLHLMQPLSLQVLVVTLDWQAEEGVEGVAFNVECCHTGGCCNTHSTLEEKF